MNSGFFNLHRHGFVRTAVATPPLALADPMTNAGAVIEMAREADAQGASLVLFPELGISAYSIDDLLQQSALQRAVHDALAAIAEASRSFGCVVFVGAPLSVAGRLYNTAIAIQGGRFLAAYPKTFLPNYREFYERRHFASGAGAVPAEIRIAGEPVPFGTDILLEAEDLQGFVLHAEICEDVWTPLPPSTFAAMAGATVLVNLSASNITIGKAEERHGLCRVQSSRCLAAYLYSAAVQANRPRISPGMARVLFMNAAACLLKRNVLRLNRRPFLQISILALSKPNGNARSPSAIALTRR